MNGKTGPGSGPMSRADRAVVAYGEWLVRWRWPVLLLSLLACVAAGYGAQNLAFKNNYRVFFGKTNPQLQAFEEIQNTYTKQDTVMFVISPQGGEVFTPEVLEAVTTLTDAAWRLPFVLRVDSITNFQHTRAVDDDLDVQDLVSDPLTRTAAELAAAREVALAEPALYRRLIAPDGAVTAVAGTLQLPEKELDEVARAVAAIRALSEEIEATYPFIDIRLTGTVMMNNAFFESSTNDFKYLVPLMYLGIIVTLLLLVRCVYSTLATVVVIVLSIITAMGIAGWLGIFLTSPSASSPIVITTLAVADCVHILLSMFAAMRRGLPEREAIVESLRVNMQPVFLTSLTTAIGFLTMNFSDAPPFHDLGNIVAIGVAAAFIYSVTFFPALMAVLPVRAHRTVEGYAGAMDRLAEFVIRRKRPLLIGSTLIALGIVAFIPRNQLNDEFIKYFGESIEFRRDTDYTLEHLTGISVVHYSIPAQGSGGVSDPDYLARLEAFAEWYRSQPETMHVNSITDVFKRLNKNLHGDNPDWYRLPEDRQLAAQYLLLYELSLPYGLDLTNQINIDKSATQLIATVSNVSSVDLRALVARSEAWLEEHAPAMFTHGVGVSVMFSHISERNIKSMLSGTLFGLLIISGLLVVALRSWRLGLISLVPNLLPAGLAFGLWGMTVGQVNVAASIVTGMSLGIVVDDTVHFLSKYMRARRERGLSSEDAVRYAFSTVGLALIVTTLVLVIGFLYFANSSFEVNGVMARLTAIAIALALLVDFLLLPTMLLRLDKSGSLATAHTMEDANDTLYAAH